MDPGNSAYLQGTYLFNYLIIILFGGIHLTSTNHTLLSLIDLAQARVERISEEILTDKQLVCYQILDIHLYYNWKWKTNSQLKFLFTDYRL